MNRLKIALLILSALLCIRCDKNELPEDIVLFTGSSTIELWKSTLAKDFPDFNVVNTGVGGTTLEYVLNNIETMIFRYTPAQVVLYTGDNDPAYYDISTYKGYMDEFVVALYQRLPNVHLIYLSLKPGVNRTERHSFYTEANAYMQAIAQSSSKIDYVDIWNPLMKDGDGDPDYFEDNTHLNQSGYLLVTELLTPYLYMN